MRRHEVVLEMMTWMRQHPEAWRKSSSMLESVLDQSLLVNRSSQAMRIRWNSVEISNKTTRQDNIAWNDSFKLNGSSNDDSLPYKNKSAFHNSVRSMYSMLRIRSLSSSFSKLQDTSEIRSPQSGDELSGIAAQLADIDGGHQAETGKGPWLAYQEGISEGLLRKDPLQEKTVQQLQRLYDDLLDLYPPLCRKPRGTSGLTLIQASRQGDAIGEDYSSRLSSERQNALLQKPWWRTLFGTRGSRDTYNAEIYEDEWEQENVQGLYMFGGVGCGKTMLMDLFAACAPLEFKLRRIHFHDFMLEIHASLRNHASTADPLTLVADDVAARTHVLCLDELFVTDVADAMILHRLFGRLWDRGIVLIATSNRKPDDLYLGGLQRALFLPFIDRLKEACVIHDMASPTDYRLLAQHKEGLFFIGGKEADQLLWERFIELSNGKEIHCLEVEVAMGRHFELPRVGGCIAHFTFEELCDRPLGAADFIALSNTRHTVAISGVPQFRSEHRAAAYRFVTLVDVLYEHRVRVLCSAETSPYKLFSKILTQKEAQNMDNELGDAYVVDDNLGFAKDRTVSRLTEMQSDEYLRAHAETHAPELLYALEESRRTRRKA